jgi:hypothetical protein
VCEVSAEIDNEMMPKQITQISASDNSYKLPEFECDHLVYMSEGRPARMHARLRLTFCPKCGVKL